VWNSVNGKKISDIRDPNEISFLTSDYSSPLKALACAGQYQKIQIYDAETMKLTSKLQNTVDGHINRIFALKFDPVNPFVLYSGSWDCYVLVNDLREKKKIGDILGPYICGEAIDVSKDGHQLLIGSYQSENYLGVYDIRTY